MHLTLAYLLAAGAGVLIAHYISRAPDLRSMRLSQLVFVPSAMVLCVYFAASGDMAGFISFLVVLIFLVLLLAPNIAYRWAQAVRHTANDTATAEVVSRVLQQSQWTGNEQHMLQQLKRPLSE